MRKGDVDSLMVVSQLLLLLLLWSALLFSMTDDARGCASSKCIDMGRSWTDSKELAAAAATTTAATVTSVSATLASVTTVAY